jgi:cell fate (sporulation/competence/biofilm development) regulator YmcA (YheA/YmcA/DUF963 family)
MIVFQNPSYPLQLRPLRGDLKANELITVYESIQERLERTVQLKKKMEDIPRHVTKCDLCKIGMSIYLRDKANKIIAKEVTELEEYLKTLPQC